MRKINRPPGVVVSIDSVNDRNPTPLPSNSLTVSIRCGNDRPNRSNRHTTKVLPGCNASNTNPNSGRSVSAPLATSVHTFQHGGAESVVLQRSFLFRGRDPGVAQKYAHKPGLSHNSPTSRSVTHLFRTPVLRHTYRACRM